jgi:hypothetical protein
MQRRYSLPLIVAALLPLGSVQALELTGRLSVLGSAARAKPGDIGYVDGTSDNLSADQQSLRLMLDDSGQEDEWSLHLKTTRQHLHGYATAASTASATLFRYRELAQDWFDESSANSMTRMGYELDRAAYKRRFDHMTLSIGRQPIDWGSGRFWQPLNVFGAFAPTDLDTDFKPGIDAAVLDWYPSAFSSLSAAFVLKPEHNRSLENSAALYYRRQVGELSELSLLGGSVLGNQVIGGAFESAWGGMGWRLEGARYRLKQTHEPFRFWIAGVDYQFDDGILLTAEWYDNGHGADSEVAIAAMPADSLVADGLQQQLGRHVLGLSLERDLTPLLHGGYTLLAAPLDDDRGALATSLLHQFTLTWSLSNESDLLFSLLLANGKGLNDVGLPQSEFGHLPTGLTLRLRLYF